MAYYRRQGISALAFRCPHVRECRRGQVGFVEAKAAFVGSEYENGTLPRLLFVSLDPGRSDRNPAERTAQAVRIREEQECDVATLPKARHWYRTHEMAWELLKRFRLDLQMQDIHRYFAHANSGKCCVGNPDHQSAPAVLFRNCRKYLQGEITLLRPDVLVTQGKWARVAVEQSLEVREFAGARSPCSPGRLQLANRPVLWLHTNHPRDFGRFNQQRRECIGRWVRLVLARFPQFQ